MVEISCKIDAFEVDHLDAVSPEEGIACLKILRVHILIQ
jgi:hypothetical protein